MNKQMRKRLKQFIQKLLAPTGLTRRPNCVTWRDGDPGCLVRRFDGDDYHVITHKGLAIMCRFIDAGDLFVAALMVVNGSDRSVLVNPRLSLLAIWHDEDIAQEPLDRLRPTSSLPADMLEAKRIAQKEALAGELYFHRKAFEAACFTILINSAFYQFAIAPAQSSGAIEGRT
jgi:hypothetical protein